MIVSRQSAHTLGMWAVEEIYLHEEAIRRNEHACAKVFVIFVVGNEWHNIVVVCDTEIGSAR